MMKKVYHKAFNPQSFGRDPKWKKEIASDQKKLANLLKPLSNNVYCCPICESSNSNKFCEVHGYNYSICSKCEHIFSALVLSQEELDKFYDSDSDIKSIQSKIYFDKKIFFDRVKNIAQPKVDFVNNHVEIGKNKTWIDIGAGVGELIYAAKNTGWDIKGLEIDSESVSFAKELGINIKQELLDDSFDFSFFKDAKIISFINVLEHIENPKHFLSKISNTVPKNSYFLIEVPRSESLSSYLNKVFPNNSNRHIYSPDHLHIFSNKSLELLLSDNKFQAEAAWYFRQDFYDLFANLALEGSIIDDKVFNKIELLSNKFQKILDENQLSDSVLILARKL